MKKIIFIRPAPYSDRVKNKSKVSGFDLIGRKLVNPEISKPNKDTIKKINLLRKTFKPIKVYSSDSMRSQKTAQIFSKDFKVCSFIDEIEYSLEYPPNTNVNILRFKLINDFVNGKLKEKPKNTLIRIQKFLKEIENVSGTVICFSNAFIMKFYEIYFRNKKVVKNHNLFLTEYNWNIKPYEFLDGFSLTLQNDGKIKQVELLRDLIK